MSFGIASIIPNGEDKIEDFINQADKAMYKSKEEGKNRVNIYEKEKV